MILETTEMRTPVGPVAIYAREGRLCGLEFADATDRRGGLHRTFERRWGAYRTTSAANPAGVVSRLAEYFAGTIDAIDAIDVDVAGTPFEQRVWAALRAIRAGTTRTYAQQAAIIGRPSAVRAVGTANGRNPIALVIPCHRVIATGGGLGGYGGGLDRKRWLLAHEARHAGSPELEFGEPVPLTARS